VRIGVDSSLHLPLSSVVKIKKWFYLHRRWFGGKVRAWTKMSSGTDALGDLEWVNVCVTFWQQFEVGPLTRCTLWCMFAFS